MAIRRVTGAVSPSELIFADANALGATYDGTGTTIERGETFTLPAAGTTAVSNGALRLEALKGDCTITNNGNSTLTNASGVNGTILMRSGASDFPAFVRNSSMGSMSTPAREDFTGSLLGAGTFDGTINSNANFPTGHVLQVKNTLMGDRLNFTPTSQTWTDIAGLSVQITPSSSSNKIMVMATVQGNSGQSVACFLRTMRDSTAVGIANTSSARSTVSGALKEITSYDIQGTSWNFIDSPSSTSALTYKVQVYSNGGVVINTGTVSADNWSIGVTVSSITVMEIKQ